MVGYGESGCGVGWGGQLRPLCLSEFPALELVDFPRRVPTLGQATVHLARPWPSGFPAGSAWDCQLPLGPKETAQGARVCPVPTPSPPA